MTLGSDVAALLRAIQGVLQRRRAIRAWAKTGGNPDVPGVEALLYFADRPKSLYQIRQWYGPVERLADERKVAVLARNAITADIVRKETSLPVLLLPTMAEVESWMHEHRPHAVFYVNQNIANFQMMRAQGPAHVFLSHGESDKDYMASNQLKAYDFTFIAGEAARTRLRTKLVDYDVDARTFDIGRPQLDAPPSPPFALPNDERTVVLYAPTWEGDRPSMSYSSIVSHGERMVAALLATGSHRVIYRPHPLAGTRQKDCAAANRRIITALKAANRADAGAGHVVDIDSDFGWQLAAADACIADISAVAYDWLATGKPLVLTQPASPEARVDSVGAVTELPQLSAADSGRITEALGEAAEPAAATTRAQLAQYYFGDTSPGASMSRWLSAAGTVIDGRRAVGTGGR